MWIALKTAEIRSSLQWLLIRTPGGEEGIRLGVPEESGWRIVDEFGRSSWVPKTLGVIAVMPLSIPNDVPFVENDA